MPSPLPGMDPWLELPAVFPDLRDSLIAEMRHDLNAKLPAPYFSTIAQRIWIDDSARFTQPDANVVFPDSYTERSGGNPRLLETDEPDSMLIRLPFDEMRGVVPGDPNGKRTGGAAGDLHRSP